MERTQRRSRSPPASTSARQCRAARVQAPSKAYGICLAARQNARVSRAHGRRACSRLARGPRRLPGQPRSPLPRGRARGCPPTASA
eukprot:5170468-Pyramimonas_sp.AAC.1